MGNCVNLRILAESWFDHEATKYDKKYSKEEKKVEEPELMVILSFGGQYDV
jgi:hypothetical protein